MRRIFIGLLALSPFIGGFVFAQGTSATNISTRPELSFFNGDLPESGSHFQKSFASSSDSTSCWPEETGEASPCETTDPKVTFYGYGDFTSEPCNVALVFDWGDGTKKETIDHVLNGDGPVALGTHTYAVPGSFTVTVSGTVLSGICEVGSGQQAITVDGFATPGDWNTKAVTGKTPGVEPLNVIISAESTVPVAEILSSMTDTGPQGTEGWGQAPACTSAEDADISGEFAPPQEYWRLGGDCLTGNKLSKTGDENHARLWKQPVKDTPNGGAWFVAASYETACVEIDGKMVPWIKDSWAVLHLLLLDAWHCIDGSPGGLETEGYNRGAQTFVSDIKAGASSKNWQVTEQQISRPAGFGECHYQIDESTKKPLPCAPFDDVAILVTVNLSTSQ